jgi:agmatine/peptidylarginine deiminase
MEHNVILPAEWYPQSAVQLTWPHENTDWAPILDEVIPCFVAIAKEVIKREKLLIVCPDETAVREQLGEVDYDRVRWIRTIRGHGITGGSPSSMRERPCFMISCSTAGE